jgi:SAM-dependent methyltransferase
MDPIDQMKAAAREAWSTFGPFESITGTAAPDLVRFAGIDSSMHVLDVGCGTGVVALTAARTGARTTGADLSPVLLDRARENAALANLDIDFHEADVEALPFADGEFDAVISQFGHMFGPRADVTLSEMLRVLKPGSTIAFSTWPPELYTGRMFTLLGKYLPAPPPGTDSPVAWGEPAIVRERLSGAVDNVTFDRGCMRFPALSPAHMRQFLESNVGPVTRAAQLVAEDPAKQTAFRTELEALIGQYFGDNVVRQDFLVTRGTKR